MTEQDELSRLARAITMAEDDLNTSNHRDDCQQLAQIDEQRTALVERIEAREAALEAARAAMTAYAEKLASAGAVKVDIAAPYPTKEQVEIASRQSAFQAERLSREADVQAMQDRTASEYAESAGWHVAEPQPLYSNGLDGYQED